MSEKDAEIWGVGMNMNQFILLILASLVAQISEDFMQKPDERERGGGR